MEIEEIIKEIQKEAQVRKSQPPHPDSLKLKSTPIQIVEPHPRFFIRIIRKLNQFGWQSPKMIYLRLASIPKWGYPLRLIKDLFLLPKLRQRIQETNNMLESHFVVLNQRIDTELWPRHEEKIREMNSRISETLNHLKQIDKKIGNPKLDSIQHAQENFDQNWLDQFYVDFENKFRGSTEEIMRKQSTYVNYLKKSKVNFESYPVLDIGCGRGEWLQMLKKEKIKAKGIDLNQIMIETCQSSGLDVQEQNAIDFLNTLEAESIGAITGFHIVEHLQFPVLVHLFDECLRVLTSDGIAIFETPNPENLMVGSCNFYTDPTHRNPIPPHTLSFMLSQRGFTETTVLRLSSPVSIPERLNVATELQEILESYYKEQDYAIIAKKF